MPLRGHVFDWPTAANRRADGGLKLAIHGSVSNDRPSMAHLVSETRLEGGRQGLSDTLRRIGGKATADNTANLAASHTCQTTETPGRRSPPCGRHLSPKRSGPLARLDRSRARRRKVRNVPRTASPTGWAPTGGRRWFVGGLYLGQQGLPPRPRRRLSHHTPSVPQRVLGAHPRGEFRRRGRRAGTAAVGGSGQGGPLV
jgi:hypothetical protein